MGEKIINDQTVGIVTYHKSLSYGGCLQAYATQKILEDLGFEPFFIDYENAYEARKKSNAVFRYGSMKERLSTVIKKVLYCQDSYQVKAFKNFHDSLPKTDCSFKDISQLNSLKADILLVASDQVWNPAITGKIDPVFFLNFGNANHKISFASSLGSHILNYTERREVSNYISDIDYISVRELFAKQQLKDLTANEIRVVMDPTLQIVPSKWREVAVHPGKFVSRQYILVYMVSSVPSRYKEILLYLRRHYNLPVLQVRLNSKTPHIVDSVIPATPLELVWLIDHAAFVLTDSFHGLAFSINLETHFMALPNIKNNIRLQELVDQCKLSDRLRTEDYLTNIFDPIDFSDSREFLAMRRREDLKWLLEALRESNV